MGPQSPGGPADLYLGFIIALHSWGRRVVVYTPQGCLVAQSPPWVWFPGQKNYKVRQTLHQCLVQEGEGSGPPFPTLLTDLLGRL